MAKSTFTDEILDEMKPEKFVVPKMKIYEGKTCFSSSIPTGHALRESE